MLFCSWAIVCRDKKKGTALKTPARSTADRHAGAARRRGVAALALASGMAAITAAIQTIAEAGDNIVSASTLYGGTYNLFAHTLPQIGIEVRFADARQPETFAALIDSRSKASRCASPTRATRPVLPS